MLWYLMALLFVIWRLVVRYENRHVIRTSKQIKCDFIEAPLIGHAYKFIGNDEEVPIIGHVYKFIGNDEDQMKSYQEFGRQAIKHNGLSKMWVGDKLFVIIADPEIAEFVLKTYLDKGIITRIARPLIGNGSIFAPVSMWRPRRKILAPTFSPRSLNSFVSLFARQSAAMSEKLKTRVENGPFSIWDYLTTYAMDSVCETTLGINVNAQENHDHQFLKSFSTATVLLADRVIKPWLHNDGLYKAMPVYKQLVKCTGYMHRFIEDIIDSKRKSMQNRELTSENENCEEKDSSDIKQVNFKTFLELLIESSGGDRGYSNIELQEEILVLVSAGTDTSAVGSSFTTLMLSRHQDVQEKVYQELQEVFGDSSRPVTAEDLPRLKYLDAVIRETLRLLPPAPMIVRESDVSGTLPSGITVVPGCVLLVSIWAVHRNPKYWGADAEQFRPERFLNIDYKHPAQFIAFSHGPRNCLGYQYAMMSMKTALATLLRQYRVLPDGDPTRPLRLKFDIMMKDVEKFTVRIERRNVLHS